MSKYRLARSRTSNRKRTPTVRYSPDEETRRNVMHSSTIQHEIDGGEGSSSELAPLFAGLIGHGVSPTLFHIKHALQVRANQWKERDILQRDSKYAIHTHGFALRSQRMPFQTGDVLLMRPENWILKQIVGVWGHAAMVTHEYPEAVGHVIDVESVRISHCIDPTCESLRLIPAGKHWNQVDTRSRKMYQREHTLSRKTYRWCAIRLKKHHSLPTSVVDNIRYLVSVLMDYFVQRRINYGGICKLLRTKCFQNMSTSGSEDVLLQRALKRWDELIDTSDIGELICSSAVLIVYQLIFVMFYPSLLSKCFDINPDGCRPASIMQLVTDHPDYWECTDEFDAYFIR